MTHIKARQLRKWARLAMALAAATVGWSCP